MPLRCSHALGAAVGWAVFACSPAYRRRFIDNARDAGYAFADVAAAVGHAGRMVAEMPRLWLQDGLPPVRMVNAECVERAWTRGRGILFLTPHLGCFELSVQAAAERWSAQHGPITILYRPARQPWLAEIMQTARNRPGISAVPTTLQGVRQMIKALRRGEAVGLLPDQVPPQGQGVWSPFFGREAYTMTLAPELDAAVLQINQAMERVIRQCPQQYLWGYARYKHPRGMAVAADTHEPAEAGR